MQSIIDKSDFTNFLQSGALLQLSSDQFKLIIGPFSKIEVNFEDLSEDKTALYKPDFWDFLSKNQPGFSTFLGTKELTLTKSQLLSCLEAWPLKALNINWDNVSADEFTAQFEWSQDRFRKEELLKAVPIIVQSGTIDFKEGHLASALNKVIQGEHYGTTYGYWENGQGVLGHSPEIVLEWNRTHKILKSMALAGTSPLEESASIITDKKILTEHQIVVEDIVFVFNKVSAKAVVVKPLQVLQLKYLNHLLTPIEVQGVEAGLVGKYLSKIHPTAALGLFPRDPDCCKQLKAFDIQKKRKGFAAPFGFLTANHVKVTAAIRSFYFYPDHIEIFSGCGVTSESNQQAELDELETKRNSVKKMMGFNL